MTRRRRDPYSWTVVRLPDRELADSVLDLASPLLAALGDSPSLEDARGAIELAVSFWNASVEASEWWEHPSPKALRELRKRLRDARDPNRDAATFEMLAQRWRESFRLDPRLVGSWSYDIDERGARRLTCEMALPEGVRAEVPPPIEKRISIGGVFLDEVRIRMNATSLLGFPVTEHRASIGPDGTATVQARMPTALQLFAEGRLPRVGGDPVDVVIGGRRIGPMVLSEIRCAGDHGRHDTAVLLFRPSTGEGRR